jgi:hypothetical protein
VGSSGRKTVENVYKAEIVSGMQSNGYRLRFLLASCVVRIRVCGTNQGHFATSNKESISELSGTSAKDRPRDLQTMQSPIRSLSMFA